MKLEKIENWYLQRTQPAFNDVEGVTAIDMVGKNTAKINEIIDLVNTFTADMESYIKEFTESTNKDYEAFKVSINQKIIDFIETVDLKLASQDKEITDFTAQINNKVIEQDNKLAEQDTHIAETITYIRENLTAFIIENVTQILKDCVADGSLDESIMNGIDGLQEQINTINTNIGDTSTLDSELVVNYEVPNLVGAINSEKSYRELAISTLTSEVNTSLGTKANSSDVYNKSEVDNLLANFEGGSGDSSSGIPMLSLSAKRYNQIYAVDVAILTDFINSIAEKGENAALVKIKLNTTEYDGGTSPAIFFIPRINTSYSTIYFYSVYDNRGNKFPSVTLNLFGTWSEGRFKGSSVEASISEGLDYVPKSSGSAVSINYNLGTSVAPISGSHYTTKTYVDNEIAKIHKVHTGTSDPDNTVGSDGDVYFQYSE